MTHLHTIEIPALKGTKVIADSKLFTYIDSDFKNWGADKKGNKTKKMKLGVFEMDKNATLSEMMSPDNLLTQEQILYFVENHKDLLRQDYYATFFPFKSDEEVFVAGVRVRGDGRLKAFVYRLSLDVVWYAEDCRRFVVATTATQSLSPKTLGNSDTLTLDSAIKKLEDRIELLEDKWDSTFK